MLFALRIKEPKGPNDILEIISSTFNSDFITTYQTYGKRASISSVWEDPQHNIVTCLAYINYRGLHCLVMELLHLNIRQVSLERPRDWPELPPIGKH